MSGGVEKLEKLVRDRIPELMQENGKMPIFRVASPKERSALLLAKLHEEVLELVNDPSIEELADVMEVVEALRIELGIDHDELRNVRNSKAERRGSFRKGIVLKI